MKYLNDKSIAGVRRWTLASRAFEVYDRTRKFANLNLMVQEQWLTITENVLAALRAEQQPARVRTDGQINGQASRKAG